ncbi:MAG: hypothetical protein KKH52_02955 [Nanoarchaeota archaeon]|nr:hypothetical protein [Nanoarchaeota archaeon]MBU1622868.1 hypothetical protein [Nanoarchaeota archaeon]MBU1974329.1 hypothetical protein [Nanoarchaeota archaeon]
MFCKQCGAILVPKKTEYGKWMSCPHGHTQPELNQENKPVITKNREKVEKIEVNDGENILAVYDHKCKKCGYEKAEMREIGAFYGDEDNVVRMKCGKCGHVEQLEGKVS